jgi:dolichol-phosphate mannosyltransferase
MPLGTGAMQAPPQVGGMGSSADKLTLVIPTLHEVESLRMLLGRVTAALEAQSLPFDILIVDDDSGDGTEELVAAFACDDPRIRLLVRKGERGLSGAILHGWQQCDGTVLGVMDADLQHPPELLPELVDAIQSGNDIAIGSRYVRGGRVDRWNPLRRLLSAVAVWVTYPVQCCSLKAHDPMSGFFLVRRQCVENVELQSSGFKLLLEILVRGRIATVREVPIAFGRRAAGKSKANLRVAWEYFRLLTRLYAARYGLFRAPANIPVVPEEYPGD